MLSFVYFCLGSVIEVSSAELARKTVELMHRADVHGRQIIVREASSTGYFTLHIVHL